MKFTRALHKFGVAEWNKRAMDFERLMQIIANFHKHWAKTGHLSKAEALEFKRQLEGQLKIERDGVVRFARRKAEEAAGTFEELEAIGKALPKPSLEHKALFSRPAALRYLDLRKENKQTLKEVRDMEDMEGRWAEFYAVLNNIRSFVELNNIGFDIILQRKSLLLEEPRGARKAWLEREYRQHEDLLYALKELHRMDRGTEEAMLGISGSRDAALKKLRMPAITERQRPRATFRVGFFLGILLTAASLCLLAGVQGIGSGSVWKAVPPWLFLRLIRPWLAISFHVTGFSFNVALWEHFGVNRLLIFGINRREHLGYQEILEIGLGLAALCAVCSLAVFASHSTGYPPLVPLLVLYTVPILWLFSPPPILDWPARSWFLRKLAASFIPYKKVVFINFWLMDQLTSLHAVFSDLVYAFCFLAAAVDWDDGMRPRMSGERVAEEGWLGIYSEHSKSFCASHLYGLAFVAGSLPHICRLVQCIRRASDDRAVWRVHAVNAGKYGLSVLVGVVAMISGVVGKTPWSWRVLWGMEAGLRVASFFYLIAWDSVMDWGLWNMTPKAAGLRVDFVYGWSGWYYLGLLANILLRYLPLLYWILGHGQGILHESLSTMLLLLEVLRRCIWNVFRLENEHVNNVGRFRANRDINLRPFDAAKDAPNVTAVIG